MQGAVQNLHGGIMQNGRFELHILGRWGCHVTEPTIDTMTLVTKLCSNE